MIFESTGLKVSCTSHCCADGGGCIPDWIGPYCTDCSCEGAGKGDCVRTTTTGKGSLVGGTMTPADDSHDKTKQ